MSLFVLNKANIESYGISISSLLALQDNPNISGILIKYISSSNIVVVNAPESPDFPTIIPINITDDKGVYFDQIDTETSTNLYIIEFLHDNDANEDYVIPLSTTSFKYMYPTLEQYPLTTGEEYIPPSDTNIYELTLETNQNLNPRIYTPAPAVQEDPNAPPAKLSNYEFSRILKAFDRSEDSSILRNLKLNETVAEDIYARSKILEDGTIIRPQFKNYNEYMSYKSSLNNRNYVRKNR